VVRRTGLLDEIPHRRRIRDVAIVRTEDEGRVTTLLEEMRADVRTRKVELTKKDRETLRV
jgi:hypothetical protein